MKSEVGRDVTCYVCTEVRSLFLNAGIYTPPQKRFLYPIALKI
jgi:hypothetical protein